MPEADATKFHFGDAVKAVQDTATAVTGAATAVGNTADRIKTDADAAAADSKELAGNTVLMDISQPTRVSKDEWKNRERMAYIALFAMIGATFALFFINEPRKLQELAVALTWFYGAMGGIVAAFMGFKAYAQVRGK